MHSTAEVMHNLAFSLRLMAADELIFICIASQSTLKVFENHFKNRIYSISISESLNPSMKCHHCNGME